MTQSEAEQIVTRELALEKQNCAVMPGYTKEYNRCFAVYYQSKQYIATKDPMLSLVGHGVVIVDKESGKLYRTGSAQAPEEYIELFENYGNPFFIPPVEITILNALDKANPEKAILFLKSELGMSLVDAKNCIQSVQKGKPMPVNLETRTDAERVRNRLNSLGFQTD